MFYVFIFYLSHKKKIALEMAKQALCKHCKATGSESLHCISYGIGPEFSGNKDDGSETTMFPVCF